MKDRYQQRKFFFFGLMLIVGLILIGRLFSLQILSPDYKLSAENNSRHRVVQYPARGLIYDRNEELLVYNKAAYDLMVVPRQLKEFDTLELCNILNISKYDLVENLKKAGNYSKYKASRLISQISYERFALFQEKLYKYPGFYFQTRSIRNYSGESAPHVLGYISEVSSADLRNDGYYNQGDYIGSTGIEKQYESVLRGEKGVRYFLVDVHNRTQGSYESGKYDTTAVSGSNIQLTIDKNLQEYGELLMQNKKGSIVAIEPSTGEILALISSPSYDPNLLVGRQRSSKFMDLRNDTLNPMFNRALMSRYAPGSIFKIVQALIGLDLGVIQVNTGFECNKSLMGCHNHPDASNVMEAIQYSCNPYFYQVYRRIIQQGKERSIFKDSEIGLGIWKEYVLSFGLGVKYKTDLPNVKEGRVPGPDFYHKWYGKNRWAFSTIYSNCNGQGEIETTPLQIANLACIMANGGFYYTPHLVRSIQGQQDIDTCYLNRKDTKVSQQYFEVARKAMQMVVWNQGGTGWRARVPGIVVCGKTGTVENYHGEDHSGFFAFAPMEEPQIAVAVYVENAGEGGTWAAPISSLLIEHYLNDTVKQKYKEQRILDLDLIHQKIEE